MLWGGDFIFQLMENFGPNRLKLFTNRICVVYNPFNVKKLSVLLVAALLVLLATRSAKANCGCQTHTPTPSPTPVPTATIVPTIVIVTLQPTEIPSSDGGLTPAGAPISTANKPPAPVIKSIIRRPGSVTLTCSPVTPVSYYFIFYGTKLGSQQFEIPNVGND